MQKSYSFKYLKIYFWQILSILLNLLSLFIVIPKLTSNPEIYGIYSICISSLIFLSYADLGFLSAGYKYASEYYASRKKKEEIQVVGFVCCILLFVIIIFSSIFLLFSFHPEWLIKNLPNGNNKSIARNLLLILAFFSPSMVLQRALQIIFGVRLEDYKYQQILVLVSALKIASVLFFFRREHYEIVQYFLFCQVISVVGLLTAFYISKRRYGISFVSFIKALHFSKSVYQKVKKLAYSTLFVTISWVLYYELDIYAIARLSGAQAVAYYSIGLTCLSFFRSIFGTLFNPFTARFNYCIAVKDEDGLKKLYKSVMCVMLPAVVFPILSVVFLSKQFIFTWVGKEFGQSQMLMQLLILSNILGFVSYPGGILMVAKQKIKFMYVIAAIQPIIYWLGIAFTYSYVGYMSFSYFTLLSFLINGCIYVWFSFNFIEENLFQFVSMLVKPALLPTFILVLFIYLVRPYLPLEKSKPNLLMVIGTGAVATCCGFATYFFTSKMFKTFTIGLLSKIQGKFKWRRSREFG